MTDAATVGDFSLAGRVDRLFRTVHPEGRGEFSADQVASDLIRRGSSTVSGTYIWQLRTGKRDNPTKKHLEALASFFDVPVSYFFATEDFEAELNDLAATRASGAADVALKVRGLDPSSVTVLRILLDELRRAHGLPPVDDSP